MLPSLTILLAEDDEEDQFLLKEALEQVDKNVRVEVVASGEKALKYLEKLPSSHLPCLIVLDYNMPGLTGQQVLQEICKSSRYKGIPKIIWSTSDDKRYISDCLSIGATTYMVKPDNVSEIKNQAKRMIQYCTNVA